MDSFFFFLLQIQIINTTSDEVQFESHKFEIPLTDHENNSHVVPPFNGFSPPGNVTVSILAELFSPVL